MSIKVFEVGLYNQEVREAVAMGERHRHLRDDWADTHYIEIRASSEGEARSKAVSKYPPDKGYVITHCVPVDD